MNLTFLGANRQVTGSRYCLEVNGLRVMIDCGLFQERAFLDRNWLPCPIVANEVDVLVLTHAHIDHIGLLPKFVREGFRGPIYATKPTVALAEVMLHDAARIQEEDAEYKRKRHRKENRQGPHPVVPLYTEVDASETLKLLKGFEYGEPVELADNLSVTFYDAGHILGAATLEFDARDGKRTRKVVFSGDIGQGGRALLNDPTRLTSADYVVMESTYGNRDHKESGPIEETLERVINETVKRGGNVVIPTFAVDRAQELVYQIGRLAHTDRIPDIAVLLDSPMASDVTDIYRDYRHWLNAETKQLIESDQPPFRFPFFHMTTSVEESKAINNLKQPCVIMASSGMCTAGRIKHHLRQNITRKESTILFVGYQAEGTLGRHIARGDKEVRIHGQKYPVRAKVEQISGLSAHGDRTDLMEWIGSFAPAPKGVFLTHGEESVALEFAKVLAEHLQTEVSVPEYRETVALE